MGSERASGQLPYLTNAHAALIELQTIHQPRGTWLAGWWNSDDRPIPFFVADGRKRED